MFETFTLIAGPCTLEKDDLNLEIGRVLAGLSRDLSHPIVFKASYDKANRSKVDSPRGPGLEDGLHRLAKVKDETGLPVITDIQENALQPYLANEFRNEPEVRMGMKGEDALLMERMWTPMRGFMLHHTREKDLMLFLEIGKVQLPRLDDVEFAARHPDGTGSVYDLEALPWYCLVPSFVLSELRIAFMMGFLLFIPFLVIDMVIASILMSMGMMMLPPVFVSLPFKVIMFVLADGWSLLVGTLVRSFQ